MSDKEPTKQTESNNNKKETTTTEGKNLKKDLAKSWSDDNIKETPSANNNWMNSIGKMNIMFTMLILRYIIVHASSTSSNRWLIRAANTDAIMTISRGKFIDFMSAWFSNTAPIDLPTADWKKFHCTMPINRYAS